MSQHLPEQELKIVYPRSRDLPEVNERLSLEECYFSPGLEVDFDLSVKNLQAGLLFEMALKPHNGCKKFAERFGREAVRFINSGKGKHLHLRGIYLKVLQAGTVKVGDLIQKC